MIDVGDAYKLELELSDFTLCSFSACPIAIYSGNRVQISAKKDTVNTLRDLRAATDETVEEDAAIYAECDLTVGGKGTLSVSSEQNGGIHGKDDLEIQNLTLSLTSKDTAVKGNDSVSVRNAIVTAISRLGDGIKTKNSGISEKGNQRGIVTVTDSVVKICAATDGIDAAYNAVIEGESTVLEIVTDKYSEYSEEITATAEDVYYIRFGYDDFSYAVKYSNGGNDYLWVNAEYHSTVSGGRMQYYYYSFPKMEEYESMQFFMYDSTQAPGQEEEYFLCSEPLSLNKSYDTFALTYNGQGFYYSWTNYTTSVNEGFGPGGMGGPGGEGNTDKKEYSTKGIKAANELVITGGAVTVKSYDDALHAGSEDLLDSGSTPLGNVTVADGNITLYSNDDGIHGDGSVTLSGGSVTVTNSYEGIEGGTVTFAGSAVCVTSADDGVNGTATSGIAIRVTGGTLSVYARGDGLDSNSRTQYGGISFEGGETVVVCNSQGNSAIDTEAGYAYLGGKVLALMPQGGMTGETLHCADFASVGTRGSVSAREGEVLTVKVGGQAVLAAEMPCSVSGLAVYLGSNSASFATD